MQAIPLSKLANQTFNIILDNQYCTITLRWKEDRIYLDLSIGTRVIRQGMVCENRTNILQSRSPYFKGTLHFWDIDGNRPPEWSKLDSRYFLVFYPVSETLPENLRY